jgi:predicted Co/Zn/Cd cation transporter (cation efflux family)
MPGLALLWVRTAVLYLAAGGILGGILLWNKGVLISGDVWSLLAAHIALMTWGWLLHLTFGVAYWILPRVAGQRPRAWLAGFAYGALNAGLLLAAAQSWLPLSGLLPLAGLLQFAAALAFTLHAWPRVRPAGNPAAKEGGV